MEEGFVKYDGSECRYCVPLKSSKKKQNSWFQKNETSNCKQPNSSPNYAFRRQLHTRQTYRRPCPRASEMRPGPHINEMLNPIQVLHALLDRNALLIIPYRCCKRACVRLFLFSCVYMFSMKTRTVIIARFVADVILCQLKIFNL